MGAGVPTGSQGQAPGFLSVARCDRRSGCKETYSIIFGVLAPLLSNMSGLVQTDPNQARLRRKLSVLVRSSSGYMMMEQDYNGGGGACPDLEGMEGKRHLLSPRTAWDFSSLIKPTLPVSTINSSELFSRNFFYQEFLHP